MAFNPFKHTQRNNTGLPQIDDLSELLSRSDKVGDRYFYPTYDGGDTHFPALYINGTILDGNFHDILRKKYAKDKDKHKSEWIVDVSTIDMTWDNIFYNNIPCAQLVLDNSHKIAELLFASGCDISEVSKIIQRKYGCKVYFFAASQSILSRTANFKRLARKI